MPTYFADRLFVSVFQADMITQDDTLSGFPEGCGIAESSWKMSLLWRVAVAELS